MSFSVPNESISAFFSGRNAVAIGLGFSENGSAMSAKTPTKNA